MSSNSASKAELSIDSVNPAAQIPRSLYAMMVLQFAVGGAVVPFITILLRDRGLDFSQISQVFFASSSTLLVFPFLWGMVADRFVPLNRLFMLVNLLAATALVVLINQTSFVGLMIAVASFYACFNPTLILVNTLSFHHLQNPREQFAKLRAWGSAGWIVPSLPISVWLAFNLTSNFDFVLYLGVGFGVAMMVAAMFLPYTAPGGKPVGSPAENKIGYWPAVRRLVKDSEYLTIIVAFFFMSASFSIMIFYSPPFLQDLGVRREWIGPIQGIGVVLEIMLFPRLPWFVRRWGYVSAVLIGCGCLVLRHLLYFFSENTWILSGSYLLAGMVIVFFHIGCSLLVNIIARGEVKATAQTLLVLFGSGLGPMFANGVAGFLARRFNDDLRPVFLFAAGLAGLAMVMVLIRGRKLSRRVVGDSV